MPNFKSTYNILKKQDEDEVFESKWMNSKTLTLPPRINWDYSRELKIEDVDIWEVLFEQGGGIGVYASWLPYAEFYLLTKGPDLYNDSYLINNFYYQGRNFETFYGKFAQKEIFARAKELGIHLPIYKTYLDDEIYKKINSDSKSVIYFH